jgi:hypothetical protein
MDANGESVEPGPSQSILSPALSAWAFTPSLTLSSSVRKDEARLADPAMDPRESFAKSVCGCWNQNAASPRSASVEIISVNADHAEVDPAVKAARRDFFPGATVYLG